MGLFLSLFGVTLVAGIPIALALGMACAIFLIATGNANLMIAFPRRMLSGVDQFVLLTIPLFILAGNLMNSGGITQRIIRFSQALVGQFRGGLSLITVVTSMLFGGVSGAATAEAAAIGSIMVPSMVEEGYHRNYAAALTAVSSVVGPIIPPSIAMIIYGVLTGTSIADLFMAGIIPGLLVGAGLIGYAVIIARRRQYPVAGRLTLRERFDATWRAIPAIMLPVIILGGILTGVFTPTESAAAAVLYALIVSAFFYRTLRLETLWRPMVSAAMVTSAILFIVAMANVISFVFSFENIPQEAAAAMLSLTHDKALLLLLINGFLLLLGLFLEPIAAMILTVPVLIPIVQTLHINLVHFGVIVVLNLVIGLATPPVGLCLFILCSIAHIPLEDISRASFPLLIICAGVLMLVTFVPEVSLTVPAMFAHAH
jgi:C4-dicarboxylate transporter DctM subunit